MKHDELFATGAEDDDPSPDRSEGISSRSGTNPYADLKRKKNAEFVQGRMGEAVEVVREQTEQNVRTAEAFARGVSRQQEGFRALTQAWAGASRDFFSPFAYFREDVRTFQRAAQKGLETTEQVARQGLRASEQATREAELRTAVVGALGTASYDELSVAEVSRRIEALHTDQLRKVHEFEKKHKNREKTKTPRARALRKATRRGPGHQNSGPLLAPRPAPFLVLANFRGTPTPEAPRAPLPRR